MIKSEEIYFDLFILKCVTVTNVYIENYMEGVIR